MSIEAVARHVKEREIHCVHSATLAYEDGIVFMSEPFAWLKHARILISQCWLENLSLSLSLFFAARQ